LRKVKLFYQYCNDDLSLILMDFVERTIQQSYKLFISISLEVAQLVKLFI
jgi:hypothetical protein